jgi:DNA polymerase I
VKIFIVDGTAMVFRTHFALQRQPLVTRSGEITNAAYGSAQALLRLQDEYDADAVLCAFDVRGKNFRHALYPEYKAHRPPTPPEILQQIPRVREIVSSMGIPVFEQEGVEADDVIATLARQGAEAGHEMWIYSGDKDFIAMVGPKVRVLKPAARTVREDEVLDEDAVRKKFGLRPAQYRDVLALMGDKADNVPGVPGVGEKTALKLVQTFESVERLLEKIEDKRVSPRQRTAIREHLDSLELSRELVTLRTELSLELEWAALDPLAPWTPDFHRLCQELEFQSILDRFPDAASPPPTVQTDADYRILESLEDVRSYLDNLDRDVWWALDTETTSLDPLRAELVGISVSDREGHAAYLPVATGNGVEGDLFAGPPLGIAWEELRPVVAPWLEDASISKVGQNIKYDQVVLRRHGVEVQGVIFDTLLASHLLAPERRQHNMDALALEELGYRTVHFNELFEGASEKDIRKLPLERLGHYACEDADITLRLAKLFAPRIDELGLGPLLRDIELPLSRVLQRMETDGVRLDLDHLETLRREWQSQLQTLTREIHEIAGEPFNLNSPKQLQTILFDKIGLTPKKKTSTGYSTDVSVLTALAGEHPLPAKLLDYRQFSKLLSTYVEALPKLVHPETGCVHTSFKQSVAATGRLSSADPNLQNIPIRTESGRRIREAFVPREEGWIILAADYSQIELRLMAHFSKDEAMCEAFRQGEDIHKRTAALVNHVELDAVDSDMRRRAKAINFGILYGMGARALGQQIEVSTKEAKGFIDEYFARLPRVKDFIEECVAKAERDREVRTLFGRRRPVPELSSSDPRQRSFGERIAVNTPIQGSAADLIKIAMIHLDSRMQQEKVAARMLLQVHDELVFEVDAAESASFAEVVRHEMESVAELMVPLVVDLAQGPNWAQAKA